MEENKNENLTPEGQPEPKEPHTPSLAEALTSSANPLDILPSRPKEPESKEVLQKAPEQKKPLRRKVVRKIGPQFYLGCLGFILFLFVLLVSLIVLFGGVDLILFEAFNIPADQIPGIISGLVNTTFGIFILLIFIGLLGSFFQMMLAKKEEKERKKKLLWSSIFMGGILLIMLPFWFLVASSIKPVNTLRNVPIIQLFARDEEGKETPIEDATNLNGPIEVKFSAEGAQAQYGNYRILNYEWDLDGDGEYREGRTGKEVVWEYIDKGKKNGLYDITLKMTAEALPGARGVEPGTRVELLSKTSLSLVKFSPNIVLTTDPVLLEGSAPFLVTFNAEETTDADSADIEYTWNFDEDGDDLYNDAKGAEVKNSFKTPGEYRVSVRASDNEGNFRTKMVRVVVTLKAAGEPVAEIAASPEQGRVPLKLALDATGSKAEGEATVKKFLWNLGDGTIKEGAVLSHTYTKAGTYVVELTITDSEGRIGKTTKEIKVQGDTFVPEIVLETNPPLVYNRFTREQSIEAEVPQTISFDASRTIDKDEDIIAYEWDFDGDGVFDDTGEKVSHTYDTQGTKLLRLAVRDSKGNRAETTLKIVLTRKDLQAVITATPPTGYVPLRVGFDGSGSRYSNGRIDGYIWDFGDGSKPQQSSAQVSYTYREVGTYNVKLTVLTSDGKEATTTQRIIVNKVPLKSFFEPNVRIGKAPLAVSFSSKESTGSIDQYLWDFGTGDKSTEISPRYSFTRPGKYTVTLRVIDKDGLEDEYRTTIEVFQ
jgi:PKD repeat protein